MSEKQKYPAGWDAERIRGVLAHYDGADRGRAGCRD